MDRLQKKCFIVSAGVHLLLVLILIIGPAFQSSKDKADTMPVLDFVPFKTVDAMVSGGGNPNGSLPRPAPPEPKPPTPAPPPVIQPQPVQRPPEPEPPKDIVKPAPLPQPNPESLEPSLEPKRKKIEVSTTQVTRKRDTKAEAKARAEAQAREESAARQRLARQIGAVAEHISGEVSAGTSLELKGPGGGGIPYANFNQSVMSAYQRVWRQQEVEAEEATTVEATVTIARDGTVISARIIRPSGNASVDRAVQATLDRVKYAAPLPDDAKENQRTVSISFYAKPRRSIG